MFRLVAIGMLLVVAWTARAGEFPETPDDPSAFSSKLDARDYDDQFTSVEDVLEQVAGVRVRRYGGLGSYSTASIRGSKPEQVLVLLDGVRLNSAHRGSVDLSTIELRGVGTIEVIRGGGSARYGSDAMGGVISITTRRGSDGDVVDAALRAGDLDTLGGDLFAARSGERARGSVAYSRLRSDNDFRFDRKPPIEGGVFGQIPSSMHRRRNADFVEDSVTATFGRDFGRSASLDSTFNYYRKDNGQPGSLLGIPVDDDVACRDADEDYRRAIGGLKWREGAFFGGSLEGSAYHRYEKSELHDPGLCFSSPLLPLAHVQSIDHETAAELRYAGRLRRLGPARLVTRGSLSTRYDQVRATDADNQHRVVGHAFVQQDVRFFDGAFRLVPALGFEVADTSDGDVRRGAFLPPESADVDDDPEWLPRIGAILELGSDLRLKANYLRAYRRPNFTELFHPDYGDVRGDPTLEPEDAWNFDIGFQYVGEGAGLLTDVALEVAYFQRDIDESIEWIHTGLTFKPENTGEARVRGYEAMASGALGRLELAASYTYLNTEIRSSGADLPHSPEHQVFARAALPLGPARFWVEYNYEDEIALGASPIPYLLDEAHQVDLGVSVRPSRLPGLSFVPEGITVSSEWINVNAEQRWDSLGLPLPEETLWFVTVRGEFR